MVVDGVGVVLNAAVLSFKPPHFHQALFIGSLFGLVVALNLRVTRFFCRALCPLGALLGLCSPWSLVQLRKHEDRCDDSRRCLLHCQGGDYPIPGAPWRKAECHLCMNCVGDCPTHGISFAWSTAPDRGAREVPQLQRRAVLASLAGGVGLLAFTRSGPGLKAAADPALIRPPGA